MLGYQCDKRIDDPLQHLGRQSPPDHSLQRDGWPAMLQYMLSVANRDSPYATPDMCALRLKMPILEKTGVSRIKI